MKKKLVMVALLSVIAAGSISQASVTETLNPGIGAFNFSLSAGEKDTSDAVTKAVDWQYFQVSGCSYNGDIVNSQLEFRAVTDGEVLMSKFVRYTGEEPLNINYSSYAYEGGKYRIRGRVKDEGTGGTIKISGKWRP